jgi:hypothetical protein
MEKQLGGVIGYQKATKDLKDFSKLSFNKFQRHSEVQYLSKGTYGVALMLTIDHAANSPYIDLEGKPVKVLIVKIGIVTNKPTGAKRNGVTPTKPSQFRAECDVQETIFRSSLEKYNSALCPAIIYIDTVPWKDLKSLYPKLAQYMKEETEFHFSLIGMETFPNVDSLYYVGPTPPMIAVCFYLLLRLGALGFAHGDPSLSNIIVDKASKRPYLIDFGNPVKLSSKETAFLKGQLHKVTDFKRVLAILLRGFPLEYPELSNWDWVKKMNAAPGEPAALRTFVDDNWRDIL